VLSLSALALAALMAILCGNVAVLFFARAAAREAEIAVRSALGASRGRIVAQLFAEALVLAGLASAVGLLGASAGLRWVYGLAESAGVPFPFWMGDTLSPATMGYAVALALVGAVVAGALPGVKVTGRRAGADLQRLVGRGSRAGLGRFWTGIIVFQVALSALFVPVVLWLAGDTWAIRTADPGLPAEEYLVARLEMDGGEALGSATEPFPGRGLRSPSNPSAFLARYEEAREALGRRLAAESGVRGVTFARQVPGGGHPSRPVEVDAPVREASVPWRNRVQNASVDPGFFDVMGAPILAGRGFLASDLEPVRRVVVVNESFVREFLGSRNAVGRRIRYPDAATGAAAGAGSGYSGGESAPWHEIVGVVRDLAMTIDPDLPHNAGVYHPLLEETYPVSVAVHVAGEPGAFTGRLRELAMAVDPGLRIERPFRLDGAVGATLAAYDAWFRVSLLAVAVALLLTAAGIYSTVSFTVSRRTREIGVRVALGADRWQVVRAVVSRTLRQVTLGVLIGVAVLLLVAVGVGNGSAVATGRTAALVLASMALMLGVSMLACLVPTRRALAIEPTEALSADG
jgi:predicted permease